MKAHTRDEIRVHSQRETMKHLIHVVPKAFACILSPKDPRGNQRSGQLSPAETEFKDPVFLPHTKRSRESGSSQQLAAQ